MAILTSELVLRYSTTAGAAGDSTAGTASGSLGKYVSSTAVAAGANGMFDDITGAENAASTIDYRCFFLLNNNGTLTATNGSVWISAETAGGASVALATDNIAASAKGSASAQAAQIASETTTPTGVSAFSSPTTGGTGLSLGTLTAGQVKGIWIRRTAANTAALNNDGFTLGYAVDSPA